MIKTTITITIEPEKLDEIRKLAVKEYRTVNKQIAYLIDIALEDEKKRNGKN
jgi:hypothetical protein